MWYPARIAQRLLLDAAAWSMFGAITHVSTKDPVVALTFDDGPHPDYTPRLLDILKKQQARATFFMVGEAAQRHPQIVQGVAQEGHAIGNHSWDHPSFPLISSQERRAQIRACDKAIAPYGERLFRPPYGTQNFASQLDAVLLGYQIVTWDVSPGDWRSGDAVSIAGHIERRVKPGSIIVLHDRLFDAVDEAYFDREPLLETVRIFLHRLGSRFRFITVPELLRHGKPQRRIWFKEANVEFLNKLLRQEGPGRKYDANARSNGLVGLLNSRPR